MYAVCAPGSLRTRTANTDTRVLLKALSSPSGVRLGRAAVQHQQRRRTGAIVCKGTGCTVVVRSDETTAGVIFHDIDPSTLAALLKAGDFS
ncbi:MAG TPA: hypothetical protein VGL10_03075 [Gammaproteobacteria bacterium]